jgi:hypothetical protein
MISEGCEESVKMVCGVCEDCRDLRENSRLYAGMLSLTAKRTFKLDGRMVYAILSR